MSGPLVSRVLDSALPAWLKPFAVALASFGTDDGLQIFPSVATVARLAGKSERQAHRALRRLRALGVLEPLSRAHQRAPWSYHFHVEALPQLDGEQFTLFAQGGPAKKPQGNGTTRRDFHSLHRRRHDTGVTSPLTPVSYDPSIDPSLSTHPYARARKGI